jgi:hypothetical protein
MRALVQNSYDEAIFSISQQQVKLIANNPGGSDPITLFDYTYNPARKSVHSVADSPMVETLHGLGKSEWTDIVARAARSRGRIQLHVMQVPQGSSTRFWVVPLRTNSLLRHDGLLQLAGSLPADFDAEYIANEVGNILDLTDSAELVEIH